jgi:hypothetical protein
MKKQWHLIALGCVVLAAFAGRHRPDIPGESWTRERMSLEMDKLGFRSLWVNVQTHPNSWTQGLYLARQNDPRAWEEIVSFRARRDAEELWRGLVVINRESLSSLPDSRPDEMRIGPFTFFGDPEEIARIATQFR